ncbi:UDP-glucose dehydrogenase family protein [Roseicyclus marinus]|uniref:UDP-glucose dehydrogenase family protein n=1 Tax=Roseicyclus marinus TaxID=2161673 RepID=UPI00240FCA64|nr:UDP-glucose/GDP-mannose dehydrogenase family protein [Roseicyclus marinus]MDG3042768.1 UDP-glucose/GDP-mannose dehydrogenase family protein [Roseicyclus marinus]
MKITIVGTGYVGLVSGVCLAEFGHQVTCLDSSLHKIERLRSGEIPIFEPGLEEMMGRNIAAGRLGFETQMQRALRNAEVIILAVGTPMRESDGQADLTQVFAAVDEVANALTHHAVIVTKSTVPVGTCRKIGERIRMLRPDLDFDIASNPEFLREGSAIIDFMRPDRVVLGTTSDRAALLLSEMYAPLKRRNIPILQTGLESSELIKYASNGFLATKISFVNELAGLCERVGADMRDVSLGMGLDGRIGPAFLKAGPGYGGSCFPKDTHALARMGQENGLTLHVTEAVMHANELVKARMIQKIVRACGGRVTGKTVAVLGVTFKANTDDVRDAPSLTILPALIGNGARVRVVDPKGHRMGEQLLPGVTWHSSAYEAAKGADVLVVMTEWQDFDTLDLKRLAKDMCQPHMVDLRNIFSPASATTAGFRLYDAIGSKANWVEAPQTAVAVHMPPMDLSVYTPATALNGQSRPLAAPIQMEVSKPAP